MPAFQLRLPAVSMCIDETRRDNLVCAVNDLSTTRVNISPDLGNFIILNKDIRLRRHDVVLRVVDEDDAVLEQKGI